MRGYGNEAPTGREAMRVDLEELRGVLYSIRYDEDNQFTKSRYVKERLDGDFSSKEVGSAMSALEERGAVESWGYGNRGTTWKILL